MGRGPGRGRQSLITGRDATYISTGTKRRECASLKGNMEERAERLIQNYARYGRISELPRIREAFRFAAEAHKEQFRASGEPYISHPLAVAEIVIAVLLVIAVIVGVIFGFMKNGLNNLFFIAKIVAIVLLVPVFNKIGFIASWITSLGGVLPDALSESLRNMLATAVISLAEAIVLFIVLSIVFAVIKWLLRKLTPKMGVMKLIDHILGGVVNFALYGVIFSVCSVW